MTKVPQSVLVAVDFGDASAQAVAVGSAIAEACGARLRLLHAEALDAPAYFTHEQLTALEHQRQATRAQAEQFLMRFGRRHSQLPFAAVLDDKPPDEAILHESLTADLVVMGTHGRHGPKRWWLGSVAERVLREVSRPLLIVRGPSAPGARSLFDRMLVHAATPLTGEGTLQYARDLAACFQGSVDDGRHRPVEPEIERIQPTMLVVAAPAPRPGAWLSNYGEPLVRFCRLPILFVPEFTQGGVS